MRTIRNEIYGEIVNWIHRHTNISLRSAHWIAAMSIHETGAFTSAIFRENRNLFGMKVPLERQTLVIGENRGHGVFRTYDDSMIDFVLYLQEFRNNPDDFRTLSDWVHRLKRDRYFEDTIPNYLRGVQRAILPAGRDLPAPQIALDNVHVPVMFKSRLNL